MTIGELSKLLNLNIQTLRYYESLGLLGDIPRGKNSYREYNQDNIGRMFFIVKCKEMGFSLKEIKSFINGPQYKSLKDFSYKDKASNDKNLRIEALNKLEEISKEILELYSKRDKINEFLNSRSTSSS